MTPTEIGSWALINATVYTGGEVSGDRAVVVKDGKIAAMPTELDEGAFPGEVIDLSGLRLAPGLIDLQVNGGGDLLFNDSPSPETLHAIVAAHMGCGTTDILATYLSGPADGLRSAADAIREAKQSGLPGLLGAHFEGPLLSMSNRGVHSPFFLRGHADDELLDELSSTTASVTTMVTLAPEVVPPGFVKALANRGVVVSAGHTEADPDEIQRCVDEGLRGGTHVWNAMPPIRSRRPGPVAALLSDPRVWCGYIADGHHVSTTTLSLSLSAKSPRRSFLVSDAMPPVGGTGRTFTLDGNQISTSDGRCVTADGRLAGGGVALIDGVRRCVHDVGIPLDEALRMATLYPAECLGIEDRRGRIAVGYPARLVALDGNIRPVAVASGGNFHWLGRVAEK